MGSAQSAESGRTQRHSPRKVTLPSPLLVATAAGTLLAVGSGRAACVAAAGRGTSSVVGGVSTRFVTRPTAPSFVVTHLATNSTPSAPAVSVITIATVVRGKSPCNSEMSGSFAGGGALRGEWTTVGR